MKDIRLKQLELTNYRNIDHEVYVFSGSNAKIVGENRIGKTNTLEAIYFLLTNYLLDGSSDLNAIKPLADTKRVVSVKGTFDVDGVTISLEKRYEENWAKTRGTGELVLKGHTETYIFNDIPQDTARQYYDLLNEHFGFRNDIKGDVDTAQMLCNPLYIGNLGDSKDWTGLRSFIIKTIGDVTDEEVYTEEPLTMSIKEDLDKALGKTENVKKLYNNDIQAFKEKIKANEAQIELLERTAKPTNEEVEFATAKIKEHQDKIESLEKGLTGSKEVSMLELEVFNAKKAVLEQNSKEFSEYKKGNTNQEASEKITETEKELSALVDNKIVISDKIRNAQNDIAMANIHVESCKSRRESLLKEYHELDAQKKDVDSKVESVCPTCGRPLEEDKVKEAKNKYLVDITSKQDNIVVEGKSIVNEMNGYVEKAKASEELLATLKKELADVESKIATTKGNLEELKGKMVSNDTSAFVESDELKSMRKNLTDLEAKLLTAKQKESENNTNVASTIEQSKQAIREYQNVLDNKTYYDRQMQVLEGVKEQLNANQRSLADVEQKKELLDKFIYTKLRLLDKHVANVFGNIKFQLIKENINGGFDPVCKPYIYDVDKNASTNTLWKSGSKSEKIITGIAIVEAIKTHLGLNNLPYLFDEGGEISTDTFSSKFKTNAQIICVKVEDNILKPVVINF